MNARAPRSRTGRTRSALAACARSACVALALVCVLVLAPRATAQEPGHPDPAQDPALQDPARREPAPRDVPQPDPKAAQTEPQLPPSGDNAGPGQDARGDARTPPTVVAITVVGERRYTAAQLVEALGQPIGAGLDRPRIERGIDTLFKAFHVRVDDLQIREVAGGVELRLVVAELSFDLEPRFVGNAEVKTETLYKWAQLSERGELYLYQADRVRTRLLEGYRQDGYYFAEIDIVKRGESRQADAAGGQELADVIFEIREGPQVRVADVQVRGNDTLPNVGMWFWRDGLFKLARAELEGPSLFNWYGAKFDAEKLQADLLAMREVYRDRGYLDAVVELEPLRFSADRSRVTIPIVVDEGVPYRVSKLGIRAVKRAPGAQPGADPVETPAELVYPEATLLALCKLTPGKVYERTRQALDGQALRKHYGKDGYLSHPSLGIDSWTFLDPDLEFDFARHEVAVTYKLAQGEQRFIREVLFEGARHTRDRVLRREVDVMPGEKADIEEITKSLGRIYSTNYFSDEFAPLDHKDPTYSFKPVEGFPSWLDLVYSVEEGRVVDLQLSGGVSSNDGAFGRISLRMRNFDLANPPSSLWRLPGEVYDKEAFHGAGQLLALDLSPGTVVNSYSVQFIEPDLFRTHFDRTILDLNFNLRQRRYRFFDEEKLTQRIRLGREFGRNWTVYAGFTRVGIDVTDIEATLPSDGFQQPGEVPLAQSLFDEEGHSVLQGGLFDVYYRDVDRTLNPTEGFRATWKNALYGAPFGGDWDFVHSDVDVDWFWPIGPDDEDVRPGVHLALSAGIADDRGGTRDVPYTERYQLGGNHILRGFAYRGVGPNLGGEPLGGETMLSGSLEYRHPLHSVTQPGTYKKVEVFHLTLFTDAGVLDPDPWRLDPSELRASVGFSLGMSFPIPISLNFGFPVASGEDDRRETFSFSIVNLTF